MSNRDPRQRFDYQNWLNGQVAERAKASLTARDAAFAENNAGVTRAALTQYLNVCAAALGHSPSPTEIDGGAFIEQRFGSWDNAMTAAGLPRPKTTPKLKQHTALPHGKRKAAAAVSFRTQGEEAAEADREEPAAGPTGPRKGREAPRPAGGSRGRESRRRKRHQPLSSRDSLNRDCQLSIGAGGVRRPLLPSSNCYPVSTS